MKSLITAITVFVSALAAAPMASATPTLQTFGVNGNTGVFNCPYNVTQTACPWSEFTAYNGTTTVTATSASSYYSDARGTAIVSGEISTTSYLPTLHAYASSNPAATGTPGTPYGGSSMADANIWGVQGYQYNGSTPFLLTITATLDSVFSRPNSGQLGLHSGFRVSLFDTAGYAFAYATDGGFDGDEMCPILYAAPVRHRCASMPTVHAFVSKVLTDTGTITGTVSYLLAPGQRFYVSAFLDANACCGATVDSSHTLNLAFNDASRLDSLAVPGVMAIPEPATLPLFAAAFALLGLARSRRAARRN